MQKKLSYRLSESDLSVFPDFYIYESPLDKALWVLWVAKEASNENKLSAKQIVEIIIDLKEISVTEKVIINALNRAGERIHKYCEGEIIYYEIMKPGKDHLRSKIKADALDMIYFEPGKRFTNKKILLNNILADLRGDLKIVDPYCGRKTLDILTSMDNIVVKFLTRLDNLRDKDKAIFLRDLNDFKNENFKVEFKNYQNSELHDRYIISSDRLILLGQSLKDFGGKETFALTIYRNNNKNIFEAITENFDRRWKHSQNI